MLFVVQLHRSLTVAVLIGKCHSCDIGINQPSLTGLCNGEERFPRNKFRGYIRSSLRDAGWQVSGAA